jgi:HEAT repeat protein
VSARTEATDVAEAAASAAPAALIQGLQGALDSEDAARAAWAIRKVRGLSSPALNGLLSTAMRHGDSYVRKTAVEVAKALDALEVMRAKIGCLQDEEVNVRESAVASLEGHAGTEVKDALLRALTDPFWTVRKVAVEALKFDASLEVTTALRQTLGGDEDGEVRRSALVALWSRVEAEEQAQWARRCVRDCDTSLRLETVRLIETAPMGARRALLEPLLVDASAMVRNAAARALARVQEPVPD